MSILPNDIITSIIWIFNDVFNSILNMKALRVEPERAKAIGRLLFQKYDLSKRGVLEPKQCFEVFSDFCYRILVHNTSTQNIHKPPTMEEAESMHKILDANHDSRVT